MKDKTMIEKIKTVSKYVMNILAFINAVIIGLSPIWGWNLDKITDSVSIIIGLIGVYLVSGKLFEIKKDVNTEIGVG